MENSVDDIFCQIDFDSLDQLDWDNIIYGPSDVSPSVVSESSSPENFSNPSPDPLASWIGQVEDILMKDDDTGGLAQDVSDDFFADLLVDSPPDVSGDVVADISADKDSGASDNGNGGFSEAEKLVDAGADVKNDDDGPDDPVSKKQRRQLRNRDAAVRSRQRKKMYVTDLEMKSKYFEGECRRLGRMLQCLVSENQALRLAMQTGSAYGVTSTKQESAVLLLESLLLGSLLWYLGFICLFNLPKLPQSAVLLGNVKNKKAERGVGSEALIQSFPNGRRCKAWRRKMKAGPIFIGVLVV